MVLRIQRRLGTWTLENNYALKKLAFLPISVQKSTMTPKMVLFFMNGFILAIHLRETDSLKINLSRRCPISNGHEKPFLLGTRITNHRDKELIECF